MAASRGLRESDAASSGGQFRRAAQRQKNNGTRIAPEKIAAAKENTSERARKKEKQERRDPQVDPRGSTLIVSRDERRGERDHSPHNRAKKTITRSVIPKRTN